MKFSHSVFRLKGIFEKAKPTDTLKKCLVSNFEYGPALLEHFLHKNELAPNKKLKDFEVHDSFKAEILKLYKESDEFVAKISSGETSPKGFILQKKEKRIKVGRTLIITCVSTPVSHFKGHGE